MRAGFVGGSSALVVSILLSSCAGTRPHESGDSGTTDGAGVLDQTSYCVADAGPPCSASKCGNKIVDTSAGESCDDGNRISGDGCSADCTVETDFRCDTPGQPCV